MLRYPHFSQVSPGGTSVVLGTAGILHGRAGGTRVERAVSVRIMKKVVGFLLVAAILATPVSRVALAASLCLGWLLWKQCSEMSAQQKLRPIRIPLFTRNSKTKRRN